MVPVREELRGPLGAAEIAQPAMPLVANHSGQPVDDAEGVRTALIEQIAKPVRFADCVRSMVGAGCTSFLELGPGKGAHGPRAPGRPAATRTRAADSHEQIEAFSEAYRSA